MLVDLDIIRHVIKGATIMKPKTKQKQCVHLWLIDPPDNKTSFGRCKLCGMVKEFINDWTIATAQIRKTPTDYNV